MRPPGSGRRARAPLGAGLPVIGLAVALLIVAVSTGTFTWATAAVATTSCAYAIAGMLVWLRRREYWIGPVMVIAGYLTLVSPLARFADNGALLAIGNTMNGLQLAAIAYLLLTYPSGKPVRGPTGVLAAAILFAPVMALADLLTRQTGAGCAADLCATAPNPFLIVDLGVVVAEVTFFAIGILAIAVLGALTWRYVSVRGASRRALAPVVVAGMLAALSVAAGTFLAGGDRTVGFVLYWTPQLLIPLALGIGFLRSRMARAGVADLVMQAGAAPSAQDLDRAVRRALHDPSARIVRWSGSAGLYLDAQGVATSPSPGAGRQLTMIAGRDGPLAAIEHDPVLAEEGDLLPSVMAAVRIVLENDRLTTSIQAQAADAARLPRGIVTFIYTDIQGSTELLDQLRERYAALVSEMRQVLRRATRDAGGTEIDSRADEFFAAIPDPAQAVRAAVQVQQELAARPWPDGVRLRIRIGLHTGEPDLTTEGYVGMDVHLAARVGSAGNGGQIVVSETTREAVRDRILEAAFADLGRYQLKGIPIAMRLYQVSVPGMPTEFGPLRAELASA
jgi:class 3 adenylate cyclase